jgi:hypothetical protein
MRENPTFTEIKKGRAVEKLEFSFKKTLKNQVYDPVKKKIRTQLTRPKRKKMEDVNDIQSSPEQVHDDSKENKKLPSSEVRKAFSSLAEKMRLNKNA